MRIAQIVTPIYNAAQVLILKRRLFKVVTEINALFDRFNCGAELIDHITGGRLRELKGQANTLLDSLAKIDPTTPDVRYDISDKKEGAVEL